jgi:hypothetical protein
MRITKKAIAVVGVAAVAALALTGCAGGSSGPATGTPIKVAAITDTKGFPEASAVAAGYFVTTRLADSRVVPSRSASLTHPRVTQLQLLPVPPTQSTTLMS